MPTTDRDVMGENEIHLRHQHSISSDSGRAVVPMWDSSDPERAPPPLPMNPSSPSLVSKPNTSSAIQSAHVALTEKAWESGYVTNPPPKRIEYSPERLLMKGVAHKRIKSLQPNVRDLNNSLEGGKILNGPRSLEKSPTRRGASFTTKDFILDNKSPEKELRSFHKGRSPDRESKFTYEEKSPEKQRSFRIEEKYAVFEKDVLKDKRKDEDSNRQEIPSSSQKDSQTNDILKAPSTLRRPHHSILGENTPPQSATMLALQSIASKDNDSALRIITNDSTALVRTPQAIDAISNQIISLTNIATSLQKEMAQLSRRSKDNATDLVSLKEATNARDEDIRKSLRELVQNLNENGTRSSTNAPGSGNLYLDNKAHNSSVFRGMKGFSLPRISSPASFATSLDRESIISPASYVADGVAIIALLEKVLREMATREGQERLLTQISNYFTQNESSTEKKVDDLILLIKSNPSNSDSLAKYEGNRSRTLSLEPAPRLELDFEKSQPLSTSRVMTLKSSTSDQSLNHGTAQVSEIFNEDTIKLIRIIKDSVTQGGGLTAEVKALVRELRGEVLGMGREIGRKFEELNEDSTKSVTLEKEHVSRLLKNGIDDLKTHVDQILREYRRQSVSTLASKTIVDYQEVCSAVRDTVIQIDQSRNKDLEKQDILDAVKDAWENYKPEIEFQQFGLERDELLTCLKDGLQKYAPQNDVPVISGATRDEVYEAVVDGLKDFSLPCINTTASISREEILTAFRESLEEFEFPSTYSKSIEIGITKDVVLEAVKEGLQSFDFSTSFISSMESTNIYLSRNDIIEAIKDGIKDFQAPKNMKEITSKTTEIDESTNIPRDVPRIDVGHRPDIDSFISQICDKFKNILDSTRTELEIVSKEAKKNLYSSTDVTEKLLETTRDGIEKIQLDMGEFVSKASGYEVKDNIDEIKTRIDSLREEVEWLTSSNSSDSSESILTEIKNIRDILLTTAIPNSEDGSSKILDSLQEGLESIKQIVSSSLVVPSSTVDENKILMVLKDDLDIIKEQVSISRTPETSPEQMIILDTIKDDLENIKKAVSSISTPGGLELARDDILDVSSSSLIHRSSELDKDEIINAMRNELEVFKDTISSSLQHERSESDNFEAFNTIKHDFESLKQSISPFIASDTVDSSNNGALIALRKTIDNVKEEINIQQGFTDQLSLDKILETIKFELSNVQTEIGKVADYSIGSKGIAVNQDIQKTLQDGLESIRADIHELRKSIYDEKPEIHNNSSIVPLDLVRRDHVDNLESYATGSQINTQEIEAICSPPSEPTEEPTEEPLFKSELEDLMKNIQSSLDNLAERSQNLKEESIGREDLEAIENVVRNTKARFDDVDFKQLINKDDLNPLELLIGGTQDDLSNLAVHLEDVPKKEDVVAVESITRDVLINVESLKDLLIKTAENPEVRKEDVSAVESICSEIKCVVDKMLTTEISSLASKDDFQNLEAQVKEFKEQINDYAKNNTKLSEDHQLKVANVSETLVVIQKFLEKFEDTVQENIGDNVKRTEALGVLLEEFSKILSRNANVSEDVRLLSDVVKEEFEKSTAAVVGSKLELDEKLQQNCDKIDDLFEKRFNDLLMKFDDTRVITEGTTKSSEEKLNQIEASLNETHTVTEDLKLLAGHLSSSFNESCLTADKNSQLIIDRVEEANDRLKETHIDTKIEHQQTRENINKILCMIEGIDSTLKENSPKMTESLRDLCLITNKQHEDSRISISTLEEKISERILRFEPPNLYLPPPPPSHEIFIDNSAHEKLDKLVNGMNIASKSFSQLDMLEKIHQQVIKTAAEVKEYFNTQTRQIYDDYEEKKRATEEVSSILERKIAQKESAEDILNSLRQEEEQLKSSISNLKLEKEGLTRKKTRLNAEVAGLETALKIRREELDIMEERAGSLERRILESVIDQSRTLLISKTNKGREAMSRKRVPSHNSLGNSPTISKSMNMSQIAVDMVKTGNRSAKKNSQNNSRRILSLSQITDNASPGSLSRCHSVKTPSGILRKNSWGGTISLNHDHLNEKNLRIEENEDIITEFDQNFYDEVLSSNSGEVILPKSAGSRVSEITMEDGTIRSLERSDGDIDILSEVETPVTAEIEPTDTFVVL